MYAQPQDIIARFGAREVRQVLESDPDPQNARLLAACADAAALADTYIARAHPLPLPSVPAGLADVAAGKVQLYPGSGDNRKPDSPLPLTGNHRIAVVSSPVIYDQATLDKMDMVRRR